MVTYEQREILLGLLCVAIERVKAADRALAVYFEDGNLIKFEDCWLRDHCRCSSCYLAESFQRAIHLLDIPDVTIKNARHDKSQVFITFSDNHESTYSKEFLSNCNYKKWIDSRRFKPKIWHGDMSSKVPQIHVDEFIRSVDGAKRVFQSLLDYGIALIVGVGATLEDTEVVCKALGGIQHTFFGSMWTVASEAEHADSSYMNIALAAHNDNTYFTEAAGLQVLHCVKHDGTGGETIIVDGFYGAQQLKKEAPKDFEFLTKFNLEAEFLEDGHHHTCSAPVIRTDNVTGDLVQIRYNVYDRAPIAFASAEECRSYYRTLRSLGKYYENINNQWRFKLKPGTVMAMDNFRVLHGRTAYTGNRILTGSYVSRSDWLDRARVLKLIG